MLNRVGKYEVEMRLGLIFIVVLLLFLNVSTAYILHHVKDQLIAEAEERLSSGLSSMQEHLLESRRQWIDGDQAESIIQEYGLARVGTMPMPGSELNVKAQNGSVPREAELPELTGPDIERLLAGNYLYCPGGSPGTRFGLALAKVPSDQVVLIYAQSESGIMAMIGRAARLTLYLAVGVLILIIPVVIKLPRQILKPFREMRETGQSAGRLVVSDNGDEVDEVIKSYQTVVDELKRNEAELERLYRESSTRADRLERLNRYILKSIGSGVINVDLSGKVIGYNRAALEILGYDEETVLGKHYLVAFPQEMELGLLIGAGLERGEISGRKEIELRRAGQPELWLGVESSIILDDNERVVGVTLLVTDMTGLKKLQNELETNRRMAALGEMTGGLAHQLRNSLAAISGFCQLLQKKTGHHSDIGEIAGSIRGEAAASETMVSRFLNFAKPLSLLTEILDVRELIEECTGKLEAGDKSGGAPVDFTKSAEDIRITGDLLLLKEALGNIIDNARQAAGDKGQVKVAAVPDDAWVNITVSDNGPGIPESIKDKLFTPFVSSKPSGTGLGLALARKIINLHQGSITFEANHPRGTICRIVLPRLSDGRTWPQFAELTTVKKE